MKKLLAFILAITTLSSVCVNALEVTELFNTSSYSIGIDDDSIDLKISGNTLTITLDSNFYGAMSWFSDTTSTKTDLNTVGRSNNKVTITHSLSSLSTSKVYDYNLYVKTSASDTMYISIINDGRLFLEYTNGSWGFQLPNTTVLQNNYNMFFGTNDVGVKTITDSTVIALSNEICKGLTNDYDKLLAIYNWVADNIYYDYDYLYGKTSSLTYFTSEVLVSRKTVCEGYSNVLMDLVSVQGIPCIKVSGLGVSTAWTNTTASSTTSNHAWNEAYLESENRWVILDSTWDSGNKYTNGVFETQYRTNSYFDISLDAISADHKIISSPKSNFSNANSAVNINSWAENSVLSAVADNLLSQDLIYGFKESITRADFCKLATTLIETYTGESIDVLVSKYSTRENDLTDTNNIFVISLYELGIVSGKGNNLFKPNETITREEAAVLLKKILSFVNYEYTTSDSADYTDASKISSWALSSVIAVSDLGIMQGSGGNFSPSNTYTLEQSIITMVKVFALFK